MFIWERMVTLLSTPYIAAWYPNPDSKGLSGFIYHFSKLPLQNDTASLRILYCHIQFKLLLKKNKTFTKEE
jgi:hypothetical protein